MDFQTAFSKIEENKEKLRNYQVDKQKEYETEIAKLYISLFPKKRPVEKLKQFATLEEPDKTKQINYYIWQAVQNTPELKELTDKYLDDWKIYKQDLQDENKRLREFMLANVPTEFPTSTYSNLIKTESANSYRSQGWGACRYALAPIKYYQSILEKAGIPTEIKTVNIQDIRDSFGGHGGMHYEDYELWAKCEKWVFEAAFMRFANINDWEKSDYKNGVNSRVYTRG
jgi:hypothetical protein